MPNDERTLPTPTPGPTGFVTMRDLDEQWDIRRSTLRTALKTWLPAPDATVGGAHVWRPETLAGLRRPDIGRPEGAKDKAPRTRRAAPNTPHEPSAS